MSKIVLARRSTLKLSSPLPALRLLKALEDGGNKGRYIYLNTGRSEFAGVSPERLFSVDGTAVRSEALAGTRPRGQDPASDRRLERDLLASSKDMTEEGITRTAIVSELNDMVSEGSLTSVECGEVSVKRLKNVMHLRQSINATVAEGRADGINYELLERLHPTPAVCGEPRTEAAEGIRR